MVCIGIFSSLEFCRFFFILNARGSPGADLLKMESTDFCWIYLEKYKHTLFPVRLISQISIVYWTRLDLKWAEEEKCPSSSKCFSDLVKISPCGKFKKFKTNKAVLTIVIGLENILCRNLVESALERDDSNVPVYSPLLTFFICNFSVWCSHLIMPCACGL